MKPSLGVALGASAANAGTIESGSGRATHAPALRRKVRRAMAFFVTNIAQPSLKCVSVATIDVADVVGFAGVAGVTGVADVGVAGVADVAVAVAAVSGF